MYQQQHLRLPDRNGPDFVMAVWDAGCLGSTRRDAAVLFCPSMWGSPAADLSNVNADGIDYTGPRPGRGVLRSQDEKANDTPIVADRMPVDPEDLDNLPHAGEGVMVLFLGGAIEFIESYEFDEGYVVFGPDSPDPRTQGLMPDEN